jgi:hypothetical protein
VTENYYKVPVFKQLFDAVDTIPIPDLTGDKSKDLDT